MWNHVLGTSHTYSFYDSGKDFIGFEINVNNDDEHGCVAWVFDNRNVEIVSSIDSSEEDAYLNKYAMELKNLALSLAEKEGFFQHK